jgi:transketolase
MTSEQLAWKIRRHGIEMTHLSKGSHIGAILSVADIIAVLYNDIMNFDPKNPLTENRDRVILSKGHAGAAIYAALAEKGFFSVDLLKTHYQNGSVLSGHVSHKGVPGVEISTGSLGHGLSIGAGMAYAAKKDHKQHHIFVILGDGENDEGSIWEAALVSNHFGLNNLIAIVDYNKMQSLDFVENTISLSSLSDKWKSFGWHVIEVDGHNHEELRKAFNSAINLKSKPIMILANTIKGKGISFMENDILWHYRYPHKGKEYEDSIKELNESIPLNTVDPYSKERKL